MRLVAICLQVLIIVDASKSQTPSFAPRMVSLPLKATMKVSCLSGTMPLGHVCHGKSKRIRLSQRRVKGMLAACSVKCCKVLTRTLALSMLLHPDLHKMVEFQAQRETLRGLNPTARKTAAQSQNQSTAASSVDSQSRITTAHIARHFSAALESWCTLP